MSQVLKLMTYTKQLEKLKLSVERLLELVVVDFSSFTVPRREETRFAQA